MRGRGSGFKHNLARRAARVLVLFVSVAAILGGCSVFAYIWWYQHHSSVVGHRLSLKIQLQIAQAEHGKPSTCALSQVSPGTPVGLLSIPKIGLNNAPVVQGTTEDQLSVAIGHDPASVWPGQPGTAVLSAHDITWFSHLPSVSIGDEIYYDTPCQHLVFSVYQKKIDTAGNLPPDTPDATLMLDTCWPINALYLTNQRFEVFARLVSVTSRTSSLNFSLRAHAQFVINAPATLQAAAQLNFPYLPFTLGTLQVTGSPDPAWLQSTGPQDAELAVLQAYQDAVVALEQGRPDWLASVAPGVSYGSLFALVGARITYLSSLDPQISVSGDTVTGAALSVVIRAVGPHGSGTYRLSVTETVLKRIVSITQFTISPA